MMGATRKALTGRLALAMAASGAIVLGIRLHFPGDCGDTAGGWTCDTVGYVAIWVWLVSATVFGLLFVVALWRALRA